MRRLFEDSMTHGCTRVSPCRCLQASTVDRLTYAHAEKKKEVIQKLESEREAVLREQTATKVFAPAFTCNFPMENIPALHFGKPTRCFAGHYGGVDVRRLSLSRWLRNLHFVGVETPQVYTNARSQQLAKKMEAAGNTAKHRMYSGAPKSPVAGSPTSPSSGLVFCFANAPVTAHTDRGRQFCLQSFRVAYVVHKKHGPETLFYGVCSACCFRLSYSGSSRTRSF